jgi:osmotically-inducible protein OsmY
MLQDRAAMLTGLGLGAGLMFFLDPARRRRRRALARDRVVHAASLTRDTAGATARDMANRAHGTVARLGSRLRRTVVDDDVLVERVRARLRRVVSHARAVDVVAHHAVVALRGPILQHEVKRLLDAVRRVPGVRDVVNELDAREDPRNAPSLQAGTMVGSSGASR